MEKLFPCFLFVLYNYVEKLFRKRFSRRQNGFDGFRKFFFVSVTLIFRVFFLNFQHHDKISNYNSDLQMPELTLIIRNVCQVAKDSKLHRNLSFFQGVEGFGNGIASVCPQIKRFIDFISLLFSSANVNVYVLHVSQQWHFINNQIRKAKNDENVSG